MALKSCFQKVLCEKCNCYISKPNYKKHLLRHENNPESFIKTNLLSSKKCRFCGKQYKDNGNLSKHEKHCLNNPQRLEFSNKLSHEAWNKGLTKETDCRVAKYGKTFSERCIVRGFHWTGKHLSQESRLKLALANKGNTKGNRSKKGFYKGIFCGSSYELIFVIYCIDHNINISRCKSYYLYEYEGKKHYYFPDFIVDDVIIEIKGYHTDLVDIKAKSVTDHEIKVLYKNDLKEMFNYVFYKYKVNEKNVHKLYDKKVER